MTEQESHYFQSPDGLRLFYREYGRQHPGVAVLCMGGLTRNSRDFEDLAPRLAQRYRVLAPDFRGRGFSDWDPNWRNYHPATYADDMVRLLDEAAVERAVLVGTSLGGLVSMILAARAGERVAGVMLNDVGPELAPEGAARVIATAGRAAPVEDWEQAVHRCRETYGLAWRDLSDDVWLRLAQRGYREDEVGVPRLDMDPKISDALQEHGGLPLDPWQLFEAMSATPAIVIHGVLSDILSDDIVLRMQARKPDLKHVPVANRGHPPLLDEPEALAAIDAFVSEHAG